MSQVAIQSLECALSPRAFQPQSKSLIFKPHSVVTKYTSNTSVSVVAFSFAIKSFSLQQLLKPSVAPLSNTT